jgi:transcriptional regulator with XRE-family HTH domain
MARDHVECEMMLMADLAERLQTLRTERNLTQRRVAQLLDISPRVYNRWEKGLATPHFDTLLRLADIFEVSLDELAGRTKVSGDARIHNEKLHSLLAQVNELSDQDQQALLILMDSLVKRSQMAKVLTR